MDITNLQIQDHLPDLLQAFPFNHLSVQSQRSIIPKLKMRVFPTGTTLQEEQQLPLEVHYIVQGRVRVLGPHTQQLPTLALLEAGNVVGWDSLLRRVNRYSLRSASLTQAVLTMALPADDFEELISNELLPILEQQVTIPELYDSLSKFIDQIPTHLNLSDLSTIAQYLAHSQSIQVCHWFPRQRHNPPLSAESTWLISGGAVAESVIGEVITSVHQIPKLFDSPFPVRLIGIDRSLLETILTDGTLPPSPIAHNSRTTSIVASLEEALTRSIDATHSPPSTSHTSYPNHHSTSEPAFEPLVTCLWNVCDLLQIPFHPEVVRQRLTKLDAFQFRDNSFPMYLRVAEAVGLQAQIVQTSATPAGLKRLSLPALVVLDNLPCVLYAIDQTASVASPLQGVQQRNPTEMTAQLKTLPNTDSTQAITFYRSPNSPLKQFGWTWFVPYIKPYRSVLVQVLIASVFVQLLGLANPLLTQQIIDKVIISASAHALPMFGILLVAFAVLESLLNVLRIYLLNGTTNRIDLVLGTRIIRHLMNLPLPFFQKRPVGEISARIAELENLRQFLTGTFLTVILDVLFSVIYIIVMLFYSVPLTLCVLGAIPLVIGLTLFGSPILQRLIRKKSDQNSLMQSYLIEILNGAFTMKAQHMEALVQTHWREQYLDYLGTGFRTTMVSTTLQSINTFINTFSSLLVLWLGGNLVLQGQLTLGGLIAFRIIAGYVTGPLVRLSRLWQRVQEAQLSMELLADIVDSPMEFSQQDGDRLTLPPIEGQLQFSRVNFGFTAAQSQLVNINLAIEARMFVGIVGLSGSGKSTLIKLLPRLYEPTSGFISIDGYDISKVNLSSLRRQIGLVPQEPVLFDGTIRDNITLFSDVDDRAVLDAAQVAEAHAFIMALPDGYGTRVGERGANLSGGQRQRIAIARMILSQPRLVVLDEATSALDYETERRVCQNLMERFRDKTVLFITHRLANLRQADQIVYLQNGSIVEQGTHQELMARRQLYYCLYSQQNQDQV